MKISVNHFLTAAVLALAPLPMGLQAGTTAAATDSQNLSQVRRMTLVPMESKGAEDRSWRTERRGSGLSFEGGQARVEIPSLVGAEQNNVVSRLVKVTGGADWTGVKTLIVPVGWKMKDAPQGRYRLFLLLRSPQLQQVEVEGWLNRTLTNDGTLHEFRIDTSAVKGVDWANVRQVDWVIDGIGQNAEGTFYFGPLEAEISLGEPEVPLSNVQIDNLPESFYARAGLEGMPVVDYASLPVINVRDAGAVGDGVTDDQPAFERALRSLNQIGGGILYLPEGTYTFYLKSGRSAWSIAGLWGEPLRNIHFVGQGESSVVRCVPRVLNVGQGWAATYAWDFQSAENVTLRDMSFSIFPFYNTRGTGLLRGMYALQFGSYTKGERMVSGVQMLRVNFDQGVIGPLFRRGCTDSWVVDCMVRNTSADGIHLDTASQITVAYNTVEYTGDDGLASISVQSIGEPSTLNRFLHNTVLAAQCRGVALGGLDISVDGNWVERSQMPAVFIHAHGHNPVDGDPVLRPRIENNTFVRSNVLASFRAYPGAILGEFNVRDALIAHNRIFGTVGDGITFHRYPTHEYQTGIEVFVPQNVTIRSNRIEGSSGYALRIAKGAEVDGLNFADNLLFDNAKGSVLIEGSVENGVFADNRTDTLPEANALRSGFAAGAGDTLYYDMYAHVREGGVALPAQVAEAQLPRINVRDFGATGDGQSDDGAALRRAIAAIPASGGVLVLPQGRYRVAAAQSNRESLFTAVDSHLLVTAKDSFILEGEGNATLLFDDPNAVGLYLVGLRNAVVRGVALELSVPVSVRHNRALLDAAGCVGLRIEDVAATGSGGAGIRIDSSEQVVIANARVENSATYGIAVESSTDVQVRDSQVLASRDSGLRLDMVGGLTRMPVDVVFANNVIEGSSEGFGVSICGGDRIVLEGNRIGDTYQSGIAFYQQQGFMPKMGTVSLRDNTIGETATGSYSPTAGAITLFGFVPKDLSISGTRWTGAEGKAVTVRSLSPRNPVQSLVLSGNSFGSDAVWIEPSSRELVKQFVVN